MSDNAIADASLLAWRALWQSDEEGWARCAPDLLLSPFDRCAILSGEAARAHWICRRKNKCLAASSLAVVRTWSEGGTNGVAGQLDFTLESAGGAERRSIGAGFWLDGDGKLLVIAEAAPAAMIALHQAYMAEART